MKLKINLNETLKTVHDDIMDEILVNLPSEDAEMISRGMKPNSDFGKAVFWTIEKMKRVFHDLMSED